MKKCFISAMLCLAFLISMASSVMAAPAYVTDPAKIKSYHGNMIHKFKGDRLIGEWDAFTSKWKEQHSNILEDKFGNKGANYFSGFSEGLITVGMLDKYGDLRRCVYMNTNGDVLDFGRYGGTYDYYPQVFKEGLSYVYWREDITGYPGVTGSTLHRGFINMAGELVLNLTQYIGEFYADFDVLTGCFVFMPRFVNGYTIVNPGTNIDISTGKIESISTYDPYGHVRNYYPNQNFPPVPQPQPDTYHVINLKGEIVETIHGVKELQEHPLTRVALIDQFGVTYGEIYDFVMNSKAMNGTDGENPLVEVPQAPTYGQASFKTRGYTIENNVGYLLIDVTNKGKAKDQGDLFYVLYNKFKKAEGMVSNTTDFLPSDYIMQLHYEVGANETKTLRLPVSTVLGYDLTEGDIDGGWRESERISESRFVLAQAENETECAELVSFFKAAHDYGETSLDYIPDNGITVLAMPYSNTQRLNYLNQKLSYFTSQF